MSPKGRESAIMTCNICSTLWVRSVNVKSTHSWTSCSRILEFFKFLRNGVRWNFESSVLSSQPLLFRPTTNSQIFRFLAFFFRDLGTSHGCDIWGRNGSFQIWSFFYGYLPNAPCIYLYVPWTPLNLVPQNSSFFESKLLLRRVRYIWTAENTERSLRRHK
jgi:hypothetical protein